MSQSIPDKFKSIPPREIAGSRSSSRFQFQRNASICIMLEYLKHSTENTLFLFDYIDDLIIVNSKESPGNIAFYQIKGSDKNWGLSKLCKKNERGILSKMYQNLETFADETKYIALLSNARFDVTLKDNTHPSTNYEKIELNALDQKELEKIKKDIEQHGVTFDSKFFDVTILKVLELSLNDSTTHTTGKLRAFFDETYPDLNIKSSVVYQHLYKEIEKRHNYSQLLTDVNEFYTKKGISKQEFDQIVEVFASKESFEAKANKIAPHLVGWSVGVSSKFKKAWRNIENYWYDPNNEMVRDLHKKTTLFINDNTEKIENMTFPESLQFVSTELIVTGTPFDNYDVMAMSAYILIDRI